MTLLNFFSMRRKKVTNLQRSNSKNYFRALLYERAEGVYNRAGTSLKYPSFEPNRAFKCRASSRAEL